MEDGLSRAQTGQVLQQGLWVVAGQIRIPVALRAKEAIQVFFSEKYRN